MILKIFLPRKTITWKTRKTSSKKHLRVKQKYIFLKEDHKNFDPEREISDYNKQPEKKQQRYKKK